MGKDEENPEERPNEYPGDETGKNEESPTGTTRELLKSKKLRHLSGGGAFA